ncbi:MAG: hypothetical protein PHP29_09605 [Tissierellia bacterium]|nr:hypothetical protein [Tissierellia bacterium]
MKICIDNCHNPMRGTVDCTGCGTPIEHLGDHMHEYLARKVAEMNGIDWDQKYIHSTPSIWYPDMIKLAAKHFSSRVRSKLFCPYCGKALQQPATNNEKPILPNFHGNNWGVVSKWCSELGLEGLPVDDYHKWSRMAYTQQENSDVKYSNR